MLRPDKHNISFDTVRKFNVSVFFLQVFSNISGFVIPADAQKLKEDMKQHIDILLEPFYDDSDLIRILPDVALQVYNLEPLNSLARLNCDLNILFEAKLTLA